MSGGEGWSLLGFLGLSVLGFEIGLGLGLGGLWNIHRSGSASFRVGHVCMIRHVFIVTSACYRPPNSCYHEMAVNGRTSERDISALRLSFESGPFLMRGWHGLF